MTTLAVKPDIEKKFTAAAFVTLQNAETDYYRVYTRGSSYEELQKVLAPCAEEVVSGPIVTGHRPDNVCEIIASRRVIEFLAALETMKQIAMTWRPDDRGMEKGDVSIDAISRGPHTGKTAVLVTTRLFRKHL